MDGEETIRSGVPIVHSRPARSNSGMSAGSPRFAPLSTQAAMVATSSGVSDRSSLNFWIPTFFSMNQGGIRSGSSSGREVLFLMARAHGRASS